MKVKYKDLIKTYQGRKDGLVYYYHPGLDRFIAREYVQPRASKSNRRLGAVSANLKALQPSEGFFADLKVYGQLLQRHPKTENYYGGQHWVLYTRLMWAMARLLDMDLAVLTREQIYAQNLPCITVQRAVEAGLLVAVNGSELLVREF